jgi:hypothetical protein
MIGWRVFLIPVPLLGLFLLGCGGPKIVEVEGTVKLNGQPLPDVMVEFLPDSEKGNPGPRATGKTDAQGHYRLVFHNQKSGGVEGKNRVLVHDLKVYGDKFQGRKAKKVAPSRVPAPYEDAARTPLQPDVPRSSPAIVDLDLTSP